MKRRGALELAAVAAVIVALAIVAASTAAAELPTAPVQDAAWLAPRQGRAGLFQSPLMAVGGYNGQLRPFHSPLEAAGDHDGRADGDRPANLLVQLHAVYLPWVIKSDGESLSSTIFIQNTSGNGPAAISVVFYDASGAVVHTLDDTIPASGSLALEQATMPGLPDGFEGGAVVESDEPVLVVVNAAPETRDRLLTYNGIQDAEREVVLPLVTRNAEGSDASLWIQNASPYTTSVEVSFHPYGGGAGCVDTIVDLPPFASFVLDESRPPCVADGFYGLAWIQADEAVTAVVALWQQGGTGASAYGGSTSEVVVQGPVLPYRQLAPRQVKKTWSSWSSSVLIANLGNATADVVADWRGGGGSASWHDAGEVPAGSHVEYHLPEVAGIPDGFDGSLVAGADQPIALVSNWAYANEAGDGLATNPGIAAYGGGAASAGEQVHLPRVAHGPGMSTQFSVQNAATLEATATVTISYYTPGGATSAIVEDAIPYKGVKRYNTLDVVELGSEWQGSASIRASQAVAVEVMQFLWGYPQDTCPEVSSPADSGMGTLRDCLGSANSGDTITFDPTVFPPGLPTTIALMSQLPSLTHGSLTIDGSGAGVVIDGSNTPTATATVGLWIRSDGNVVKGLEIVNFPSASIRITNAGHSVIGGDHTLGSGLTGEGNVLSGSGTGVYIDGTGAVSNTLLGNYIGVDATGGMTVANEYQGVALYAGADYTIIGGTTPGHANTIAGNGRSGILLESDHNLVEGNLVGLNATGSAAVANGNGVRIDSGASHNTVRQNVISGNESCGIDISGSGTMSNTVIGNFVGTDATGTVAIGNRESGVCLHGGASHNVVGGDTPGERNVISGNTYIGVSVGDDDLGHNTISGNYIGVDASGTLMIPNGYAGVFAGSSYNTIGGINTTPGGACSGECNLISGNYYGLQIVGLGALSNTVTGNYIGTDASGTTALASASSNLSNGLFLGNGTAHNLVGGAIPAERNVIAGGIWIASPMSKPKHNRIVGNHIGVDATGTAVLARGWHGIGLFGSENAVGGDAPGEGNVIAGFDHDGISTTEFGNWIGYNEIFGNAEHGVHVRGAAALTNTVTHNSIHDNGGLGIRLVDGGNADLPAPLIESIDMKSGAVEGTACALCTVEVFSDGKDEGKTFEGSTVADGSGAWSLDTGVTFTGPALTATATDPDGNTSEFGGALYNAYLPAVLRGYGGIRE